MNKGLEALERYDLDDNWLEHSLYCLSKFFKGDLLFHLQEHKALEIIKEKNINVYWLKTSPNLSRYNLAVGTNQALKKEEYDLLKEVLR